MDEETETLRSNNSPKDIQLISGWAGFEFRLSGVQGPYPQPPYYSLSHIVTEIFCWIKGVYVGLSGWMPPSFGMHDTHFNK